jgi:putative spermidine/putrescine transport system substrate-binding protein
MMFRNPTRRDMLVGSAVLALPNLIRPLRAESKVVYVNTWGGSWTAAENVAFFKPFTEATGIAVRTVAPVSLAKVKAQVKSGNYEFDITSIPSGEWISAANEGLVEPINWGVVDKSKLFPGAAIGEGLRNIVISVALVYRADKFPNGGPRNWTDFWNVEKFPGNRALYHDALSSLVFALRADGLPQSQIYPIDIDRALKKLDAIKPHIKVWWTQGSQSQQLLRDGEADLMAMWTARAIELKNGGLPIEIVWDGAEVHSAVWGVVKGAPNAEAAWRFAEFALQAEPQAEFAKRLYYGPTNPDAYKFIPSEIAAQLPTYPANLEVATNNDATWQSINNRMMQERFTQWLAQ